MIFLLCIVGPDDPPSRILLQPGDIWFNSEFRAHTLATQDDHAAYFSIRFSGFTNSTETRGYQWWTNAHPNKHATYSIDSFESNGIATQVFGNEHGASVRSIVAARLQHEEFVLFQGSGVRTVPSFVV